MDDAVAADDPPFDSLMIKNRFIAFAPSRKVATCALSATFLTLMAACGTRDSPQLTLQKACHEIVRADGLAKERDEQFAVESIMSACGSSADSDLELRVRIGVVCQQSHVIWTMTHARKRSLATASQESLLRANQIACADGGNEVYAIARNGEPRPTQPVRPDEPVRGDVTAASVEKDSAFGAYRYSYRRSGEQAVALYQPKMLPRDDAVVIGAMKQVVSAVFGDSVAEASPQIVSGPNGNLIRLGNARFHYDFMLVKEDTGEVHSLEQFSVVPSTRAWYSSPWEATDASVLNGLADARLG